MEKAKIIERLKKIQELAERGVGGEKESAMRMYQELKAKYSIEEEDIKTDEIKKRWFPYEDNLESDLLTQIFYKVTGSARYFIPADKGDKTCGCMCTEVEAAEIELLFAFYNAQLKEELNAFMLAFRSKNYLFPDKTARCYQKDPVVLDGTLSKEQKDTVKKAYQYADILEKKTPPRALLNENVDNC
jgi:hypothetical protein